MELSSKDGIASMEVACSMDAHEHIGKRNGIAGP